MLLCRNTFTRSAFLMFLISMIGRVQLELAVTRSCTGSLGAGRQAHTATLLTESADRAGHTADRGAISNISGHCRGTLPC